MIRQHTLSGRRPRIQLNFGGVAKGFSLDTIVAELKSQRVPAALVNAGGNIRAYGRDPSLPWKVAIQVLVNAQGVLGFIEISGEESIVSSGTYERNYRIEEKLYHPILAPRAGYPEQGTLAVTVIANNASLADAAVTAVVAGKDEWQAIAKTMQFQAVLLVTEQRELVLSKSMNKRFRLFPGREKTQ